MPSTTQIIRFREQRTAKARRYPARAVGLGCSLLLALVITLSSLGLVAFYSNLTADLPSNEMLPVLLDPGAGALLQPTKIYDQTGGHLILALQNPADVGRQFLDLDGTKPNFLPAYLISATLSASDPGFWNHPGITLANTESETQPSLAQRLISELVLWDEPLGLRRSLRERLLAMQVTATYGREQVLTWFLNSADYGRLVFGADSAARVYFGKPASELNLTEAAILAAVAEAPSLNPHDAPQIALQRGHDLLNDMLANGVISPQQAEQARQTEVTFQASKSPSTNLAPDFSAFALSQLGRAFDIARLERGGYRVITSLDYDLQTQATCTTAALLSGLDNTLGVSETEDGDECEAARLLQTQPLSDTSNPSELAANVAILEPATGKILALVGDNKPGLDALHPPGRSPGTLLTPLIYLSGFTRGLGPGSLLWDIPSGDATQVNSGEQFHGPVRLRTALANDYLAAARQVLAQGGSQTIDKITRELGLSLDGSASIDDVSDLVNQSRVNLLDISQAYSVLANQGVLVGVPRETEESPPQGTPLEPIAFLKLTDLTETTLVEAQGSNVRPVLSPQLSYLLTHILSDEPARWPSLGHPNPLEIGRPVAAKLGQTEAGTDAWAVGYTPRLLVGAWVGDKDVNSESEVSVDLAASLWHAVMQYASRNQPSLGWSFPEGVSNVLVCDPSGMLPTNDCPTVVSELFLAGNEPTQSDTLFRKLQINRETGRLATIFTPPELVEERTYLLVPPEAEAWAQQSGIASPPESFDVILSEQTASEVAITSPSMFAYVKDSVPIFGEIGEDDLDFYRLQVGKGLNPTAWTQVGEDSSTVAADGNLGVWDTRDANGLYALQLLVVRTDQHVDTAMIHVTVDNQPPEVQILYPAAGQQFDSGAGSTITLRTNAEDDVALQKVEFFIDGKPIATQVQPPYSTIWRATVGNHQLSVRAVDKAGNQQTADLEFTVR